MQNLCRPLFVLIFCLCNIQLISASPEKPNKKPQQAAVASAHKLATEAGLEVLRQGGNAFDAAITVAAVLGVVEPYSAGIGGGGFWLLYQAEKDRYTMIDARETAPSAIKPELYQTNGRPDRDKAINGALAAGIPGQPAAFVHLAQQYGTLPLQRLLKPAIELAKEGFEVDKIYLKLASMRLNVLQRYKETARIFLKEEKNLPKKGDRVIQSDLADTLKRLAKEGFEGFYQGTLAERMVKSVRQHGGIWTLSDLKHYRIVERSPLIGTYHQARIIASPPPSSGGIVLINMLNMLENYDLNTLSKLDRVHLITEVMRRAYRERALHLGDPDFVQIPQATLLSKTYAETQMQNFAWAHSSASDTLNTTVKEGDHTTHFSILDRNGNRVAATLSINLSFGSGFVAEGTGVLLNNELDDFALSPKAANAYGLTGNSANAPEPGKRPLSSMSPTFIETPDWMAILGTPGGSRIITMVLLASLEALEGKAPQTWVSLPRYHHQYLPDVLQFEPNAFENSLQAALQKRGHQLKPLDREYGNMHTILWRYGTNKIFAASDPRGIGSARVIQ